MRQPSSSAAMATSAWRWRRGLLMLTAFMIVAWGYTSIAFLQPPELERGPGGGNGRHESRVVNLEENPRSLHREVDDERLVEPQPPPKEGLIRTVAEEVEDDDDDEEDGGVVVKEELQVKPSAETWPMMDQFYTAQFDPEDTSTTIIFNLFKGPAQALRMQLEAASTQDKVQEVTIWVMCFNSPLRAEYEAIVDEFRGRLGARLVLTVSDFNHKFHGRFLLAYMAKTKYVLIVDDDKMIDQTTVHDYIQLMRRRPGIWGNFGHLRAATFEGYKSWPRVGYDLDTIEYAEMDYLSGMWFLEQSWLEYFVKERMPSWETSEDMHLSHVMRKYLNLNTYGGKVALHAPGLPHKKHAATVGSALDLREYIFDHQLGRGNKVANVDQPIETLVYVETVQDVEDFLAKLNRCSSKSDKLSLREGARHRRKRRATGDDHTAPWCNTGKTAVVFRGAKEQDVVGLIKVARALCARTHCSYLSVKPKIKHPIEYFNMREGFGQHNVDIPWQTAASDVLTSFVGILNNIQPQRVFLPDVSAVQWLESTQAVQKTNRLEIYHETLRLAIKIHRSSPTNQKWSNREREEEPGEAFPAAMRAFTWRHDPTDPIEWVRLVTELK